MRPDRQEDRRSVPRSRTLLPIKAYRPLILKTKRPRASFAAFFNKLPSFTKVRSSRSWTDRHECRRRWVGRSYRCSFMFPGSASFRRREHCERVRHVHRDYWRPALQTQGDRYFRHVRRQTRSDASIPIWENSVTRKEDVRFRQRCRDVTFDQQPCMGELAAFVGHLVQILDDHLRTDRFTCHASIEILRASFEYQKIRLGQIIHGEAPERRVGKFRYHDNIVRYRSQQKGREHHASRPFSF